MILHDREVRMAFTVGAMQAVAQLCPEKDIRRISEIFNTDNEAEAFDLGLVVKLGAILSYWGEEQWAWNHPGYEAHPFTEHELMMLMPDEIMTLFAEAMNVMTRDNTREVEAEPEKGKKE